MLYKFEVYTDKRKEWRFRLVAPNKEIIASGEGYKNKQDCLRTIESIKENTKFAVIEFTKD